VKVSSYNVNFNHNDKVILYNSISDHFIMLDSIFNDIILACEQDSANISYLKTLYFDYYNLLVKQGFFVSKHKNEFEEIKRISDETDFDESHYVLIINPTMISLQVLLLMVCSLHKLC